MHSSDSMNQCDVFVQSVPSMRICRHFQSLRTLHSLSCKHSCLCKGIYSYICMDLYQWIISMPLLFPQTDRLQILSQPGPVLPHPHCPLMVSYHQNLTTCNTDSPSPLPSLTVATPLAGSPRVLSRRPDLRPTHLHPHPSLLSCHLQQHPPLLRLSLHLTPITLRQQIFIPTPHTAGRKGRGLLRPPARARSHIRTHLSHFVTQP